MGQRMRINPFIHIKNVSSEVSLPLKKTRRDMSSESCAAHPVG
jgi:hypothetical protein